MYRDLSRAYRATAKDLGLRVMPVGDAFYAAETDPAWCYKPSAFDKAVLKHPNLPDQTHSIHVGWHWAKDEKDGYTIAMDGHHANDYGCYLAACVWFEVLFGESVENNSFAPAGIAQADARYMRSLAHRIVQGEAGAQH